MRSAATCHSRQRRHDARIRSRTWPGSMGSAVRNRSLACASRLSSLTSGRTRAPRDMLAPIRPALRSGSAGTLAGPGGATGAGWDGGRGSEPLRYVHGRGVLAGCGRVAAGSDMTLFPFTGKDAGGVNAALPGAGNGGRQLLASAAWSCCDHLRLAGHVPGAGQAYRLTAPAVTDRWRGHHWQRPVVIEPGQGQEVRGLEVISGEDVHRVT